MEEYKSIFEYKIVSKKQKIEYLWDNVISYWWEINSVAYLRDYLTDSPIRLLLGTNYQIFMKNYNIIKFQNSEEIIWENNYDTVELKRNIENDDLIFLEIIFNEINYKLKDVKIRKFETVKVNMFCSLPEIINDLISVLDYSFSSFRINNFSFQKLISNKNSNILNVISNKNDSLKSLAAEYLLLNNEFNLQTKRRILAELYKFIDKQSKLIQSEFGKDIKNKIFSEMNNLNIRHNNQPRLINGKIIYEFFDIYGNKVFELTKDEYIEKLDKLFQIVVIIANFLNLENVSIN